MADKHGTYRAVILFSNSKAAGAAFLSLVPKERQNKTYKATANASGEVEISKVKVGNYEVHVGAMKNPATGEKESHQGPVVSIKGGEQVVQSIKLR